MKMKDFSGKKCFITGAASGIGRATAIMMAKLGAQLFLTDINNKLLDEVVFLIKKDGGNVASWAALDVSIFKEVKKFSDKIQKEFGAMDIVMNIAGIAIWGTVERFQHNDWVKVIDVNLKGPIHIIECFIPPMVHASRGGHLVNVSSTAGLFGYPWHAAYSGSKAGLSGISEVLRYDLMQHNIGVTLVCPGAVDTPIKNTMEIVGINKDHEDVKKMQARFTKHAVSPEKVACLITEAIKKNKFLILTSFDMKLLYWFKRRLFFVYHFIMKKANGMFDDLAKTAGV